MQLPETFHEFERVIGRLPALRLAKATKDRRIYIPITPITPGHIIEKSIGPEAATKLQKHFGGELMPYPQKRVMAYLRHLRIAREWQAGRTVEQIAASHGVTERTVYRALIRITNHDLCYPTNPQADAVRS